MTDSHKGLTPNDALRAGIDRQRAGDAAGAEAIYRKVLEREPGHVTALQLLGALKLEAGDDRAAASLVEEALRHRRDHPELWNNYGVIKDRQGEADTARDAFETAIALDPHHARALANYASLLRVRGDESGARKLYERAVAADPDFAAAWYGLGISCLAGQAPERAAEALGRAAALEPDDVAAHAALGAACTELGRFAGAHDALDKALRLAPMNRHAIGNRAVLLEAEGRLGKADALYESLLQRRPDDPHLLWNRGLLKLKAGDYAAGLEAYLVHDRVARGRSQPAPDVPIWRGEPLADKKILVTMEQGLGDMVQFVRFVPMLAAQGATVTLEAYAALGRLFESVAGITGVLPFGETGDDFDFHIPMMQLPHRLAVTLDTLPAKLPYLVPPGEIEIKVSPAPGKLAVGLIWSSNPGARQARRKSCRLADFAPLATLDHLAFYSLQVGPDAAQIGAGDPIPGIVDLSRQLSDLSCTAAAIGAMDLIISIDTVTAHLAGALGAEVWTLLPFVPDWRWMLERRDSPWYPTMRLFRQPAPGDWRTPIHEMAAALRRRVPPA